MSGSMQGAIEGIKKDKVPQETIKGAIKGLGLGAITGGAGAKVEKIARGHQLKNAPKIDTMTNEARKQFRKQGEKFYKDYNQDVVVKNKDTGFDIKIVKKGADESIKEYPENIRAFPDLKKDLKNAKLTETNNLYKVRKDDAQEFYTLQGKDKHLLMKGKDMIKYYLTRKEK